MHLRRVKNSATGKKVMYTQLWLFPVDQILRTNDPWENLAEGYALMLGLVVAWCCTSFCFVFNFESLQ